MDGRFNMVRYKSAVLFGDVYLLFDGLVELLELELKGAVGVKMRARFGKRIIRAPMPMLSSYLVQTYQLNCTQQPRLR